MKKLFKWLAYGVALMILLITGVLAAAYWNRDILLERLTAELNKDINGKFYINKIDFTFLHHFPNFSITLHDVYLRDERYEKYRQDIFAAKKVFVDVSVYRLLKKELLINSVFVDDANIFVFKASNGDTNLDILKKPADSVAQNPEGKGPPLLLNLEQIDFSNVSMIYSDSSKNKFFDFKFIKTDQSFLPTDSGYAVTIRGNMHFNQLLFNQKAGSFLADKTVDVNLSLQINRPENSLIIQPSFITYKKNRIALDGKFQLQKEGSYKLNFIANDINPVETKELLNARLVKSLSKFESKDAVIVGVKISGRSIPGYQPYVDVEFETKDANFRYGQLDFSALTAKGHFTNHIDSTKARDNKNSQVIISSFKADMEKLPVEGKVTFTELQDPIMALQFTTKISFKDLNNHLDDHRLVLDKGDFTSEVTYTGKLSEYLDPTRTKYYGKLRGQIRATNASLKYKPKKIHLDQINLRGVFDENLFTIEELNLTVNGSPVAITGRMQNFIPFFIRPKNKGSVTLKVHSPNFDLTSFTSPRDPEKKRSKERDKQNRKKVSDLLDMVYDRLEFDIDLTMGQLKFRKFTASNFKGHVRLDNHVVRANPISMEVAGGTMNLNFSLKNVFDPISPMEVTAKVNNADIKELFLNFNNFNQKTIQADNLRGRISADVKLNASVNEVYSLLASSMRGTLECKISDGGLKDFEPMENMSNFLFKKRDFSDVEFAELNSSFSITGTNLDISRMEIQSSVVSLFLEGRYSFTDSTSLSVQIPLSNLKKRHKDFKPKNIGTHAKAGPSIFLHVYRAKDVNSKIQIDYDPFKKWVSN